MKYTQVITDCDKSPKIGRNGLTDDELNKWCIENGCRWTGLGNSAAYIRADCECPLCREEARAAIRRVEGK